MKTKTTKKIEKTNKRRFNKTKGLKPSSKVMNTLTPKKEEEPSHRKHWITPNGQGCTKFKKRTFPRLASVSEIRRLSYADTKRSCQEAIP